MGLLTPKERLVLAGMLIGVVAWATWRLSVVGFVIAGTYWLAPLFLAAELLAIWILTRWFLKPRTRSTEIVYWVLIIGCFGIFMYEIDQLVSSELRVREIKESVIGGRRNR